MQKASDRSDRKAGSAGRVAPALARQDRDLLKQFILDVLDRFPDGLAASQISVETGIGVERVKSLLPQLRSDQLVKSRGKTRSARWSIVR